LAHIPSFFAYQSTGNLISKIPSAPLLLFFCNARVSAAHCKKGVMVKPIWYV